MSEGVQATRHWSPSCRSGSALSSAIEPTRLDCISTRIGYLAVPGVSVPRVALTSESPASSAIAW